MNSVRFRKLTFISISVALSALLLAIVSLAVSVEALPYGRGAYGTCQFGSCSITLTSSTAIAATITPGGGTTCSVVKDNVSVRTGASTGYTLQVSDANADTNLLRSGGGTIAAVAGTKASPAQLAANKWGYRVDGVGGFGAGPTSAVTNSAVPMQQYAGMPVLASPDTLITSASAASTAVVTPVWYGICSNTSIPAGAYSNTIMYTAITNI